MPIQYIQAGDLVWTMDMDSGEVKLGKVADTFVRQAPAIVTVTVAGEDIETTTEHPFWVVDKGWTAAKDLSLCDEVITFSGETLAVENISIVAAATPVYNFEVEGTHTYYVSGAQVLVHNACPSGMEGIDDLPKKFLKDPQKTTRALKMIGDIKAGNLQKAKPVKGAKGLYELTDRNGTRVYFRKEGGENIIVGIGDKSTQVRDIANLK